MLFSFPYYKKSPIRLTGKIVIIINGKGGVGKDTICEITSMFFCVKVVSAITPIKKIARLAGWNGEKDLKSRKFLSDLKKLLIDFNNLPNNYLEMEYKKFLEEDNDIMFVHIREGDQIDDFKKRVETKCITMLIESPQRSISTTKFGNSSDDNVNEYYYDYRYLNCKPLESLIDDFMSFFCPLLVKEGMLDKNVNM